MVMSLMRSIMMKNYSVYVAHIEFDEVPEPKVSENVDDFPIIYFENFDSIKFNVL